ncbi:MAG: Lrp/AsnC ligand binding domain-containing protein [Candidatus Odinarchaeia archaeon]
MEQIISYVLLTIKQGKEHEVAEKIKELKKVKEVLIVYGMFDLVVRVETEKLSALDEVVTAIRQIPGVEQTTTLISS